jgi:hypothetical protein
VWASACLHGVGTPELSRTFAARYPGRAIRREHVAHVQANDLGQAEARPEGQGEDDVIAEIPDGGAEDQALLVGGQGNGGEVRHGVLPAAQVFSVGEEVKARGSHRRTLGAFEHEVGV